MKRFDRLALDFWYARHRRWTQLRRRLYQDLLAGRKVSVATGRMIWSRIATLIVVLLSVGLMIVFRDAIQLGIQQIYSASAIAIDNVFRGDNPVLKTVVTILFMLGAVFLLLLVRALIRGLSWIASWLIPPRYAMPHISIPHISALQAGVFTWVFSLIVSAWYGWYVAVGVPSQARTASDGGVEAITYSDVVLALILSVALALMIAAIVAAWNIFRQRQRHIVYQFEYQSAHQGDGKSESAANNSSATPEQDELRSIALTLTHLLTRHLRRVGGLLAVRQIEALKTQLESPLDLLVTSGQDEALVNQLEQINEVQISNVTFPFGRLIAFIFSNQADTRVRGSVHRNKDGSTEVWVNVFSRRFGQTFDIGRAVIQRPADAQPISDIDLDAVAKTFAIKIARELGGGPRLARSWESLSAFVDGLEASQQRNWWHAIAQYQQAIEHEGEQHSTAAIGHYHIGATLLLQGEPRLALQQLRFAESIGAVTPELLYMLGLALFTLNVQRLGDRDADGVETAKGYLRRALDLDPQLLEAEHLLGIIHYNEGRVYERTRAANNKTSRDEQTAYTIAERSFRRCHHAYERRLIERLRQSPHNDHTARQLAELARTQLMVAHHWADALRSLNIFHIADELYADAQLAFGGKTRNIVDRLLTHARAKRYDDGLKLEVENVRPREHIYLSADAQLYLGWLKAGKHRHTSQPDILVHEAFPHLDFALLLRPRFVDVRNQTNWRSVWQAAIRPQEGKDLKQLETAFAAPAFPIDGASHQGPDNNDLSLRLREYGYRAQAIEKDDTEQKKDDIRWTVINSFIQQSSTSKDKNQSGSIWQRHRQAYKHYIKLRDDAAKILYDADRGGRLFSQAILEHRHQLAEEASEIWNNYAEDWQQLAEAKKLQEQRAWASSHGSDTSKIQYGLRWSLDVFMQISSLACHLLASCNAFAHVKCIAATGRAVLEHWIDLWNELHRTAEQEGQNNEVPRDQKYRFSPLVLRYYLITLHSWEALAFQRGIGPALPAANGGQMELLARLEQLRNAANAHRFGQHPLYLFVCAEYYRACGMLNDATNTLHELLNATEAFETRSYNPFNFTLGIIKDDLQNKPSSFDSISLRQRLFYYERISGQQQFEYFVNNARVYTKLAEIASLAGNERAGIDYLFQALTWSPYADFDLENFVKLIAALIRSDRFRDALTAVQEAKSRLGNYPVDITQSGNVLALDVFECIAHTRLNRYDAALSLGLAAARHIAVGSVPAQVQPAHDTTRTTIRAFYQEMERNEKSQNTTRLAIVDLPVLGDFGVVVQLFSQFFGRLCQDDWNILNDDTNHWFEQLRQNSTYEDQHILLNQVANYLKATPHLLDPEPHPTPYPHYDATESAHKLFVHVLRRRDYLHIVQVCELYNNIAYNLAQLEIRLTDAIRYVWTAISFSEYLYKVASEVTGSRGSLLLNSISDRLARYYDTLGWIYYRRRHGRLDASLSNISAGGLDNIFDRLVQREPATIEQLQPDLHLAVYYLERHSLRHSQHLPVPNYHLSRAYLALAEEMTQNNLTNSGAAINVDLLRNHIHKAARHWDIAYDLDKTKRLHADLLQQRRRIDPIRQWLREGWKK